MFAMAYTACDCRTLLVQGTRAGRKPLGPALTALITDVRPRQYAETMTDRQLALKAWESLFRAQHELFGQMASDFDGAEITQAEYDVLLTVVRARTMSARLRDITANSLVSQPSV